MPNIVIVGGGISGLALAFRLRRRHPSLSLHLLEKDNRAGGKVQTLDDQGFRVECGPNGFLDNKPSTMQLCRDAGLETELIAASEHSSKNRFLFLDGRLKRLPTGPVSFLGSDLLSWQGKWNLLMERFRKSRKDYRDESIDAFARRRAGREIADVLVDAVITGIHAGDPKLLSLAATFPRIAELEKKYGSVLKGFAAEARRRREEARQQGAPKPPRTRLWSLRLGLSQLINSLREHVQNEFCSNTSVSQINRDGNTWQVTADDGRSWRADAVVLACPAFQQAAILKTFDDALAETIGAIPYNRVAVVAFGFRRDDVPGGADGFGYIAPQRMRRDLLGVQWCSSIFAERAPNDAVLLRAMAGGWHRPELVDDPDDVLAGKALAEIGLAMGVKSAPIFQRIVRWNRAIPQYHVGHPARVTWIQNRAQQYPGLFLAGNAYYGVALNDCTAQAEILSERISKFLEGNFV